MVKRECRGVRRALWGLAAGQEEARAARVHAHLRQCPACRVQWQAVQQTQSGLTALRDRPIPASQTNWQQAQAQITAVPAYASAVSKRRCAAPFPRRGRVGQRITWAGAATALAVCILLIANPHPRYETNTVTRQDRFAPADGSYRLHRLKAAPLAQKTMSARVVTFTGAMSTSRNAALSTKAQEQQEDNAEASPFRNSSNVRRYHALRVRTRLARQDAQRRRRWAAAALHRRLQAEVAAAFRTGSGSEPTTFLLTATVTRIGKIEPEYVMTTVETDAPTPRRYIMDSININAQNAGQANVDGLAVPVAPGNQGGADAAMTNPNSNPISRANTAL